MFAELNCVRYPGFTGNREPTRQWWRKQQSEVWSVNGVICSSMAETGSGVTGSNRITVELNPNNSKNKLPRSSEVAVVTANSSPNLGDQGLVASRVAQKQERGVGGRPSYLHRGSCHQHGVWLCQALVHKIHLFPAHRVSKEGHVGLQDATAFTASWDLEIAHLLIRQEDVPIRSHTECFSFPGRVQSFKMLLKLRAQGLISTAQAENPEMQSKVII